MKFATLYKRSTTGKISQWVIEVEGNRFRTISGFTDGQNFTSAWTECYPKNIGKKNGTTAEQQAMVQAEALYTKKKALGAFEDVLRIDEPILFKPMLAHDYNDYKDKLKWPYLSQPKLDGVRCVIKADGMWSRNGKLIVSAPHIWESLEPLFDSDPDLVLDGELFCERDTADFNKIISCVRKTKPEPQDLEESARYIQYWVYDIASHPGTTEERLIDLMDMGLSDYCVKVPTVVVRNATEAKSLYETYMQKGYEGQMLRDPNGLYQNKRSKHLLKNKEFMDKEDDIIGYEEGKGKLANRIGKLLFEGYDSAVNGDHDYLAELWANRTELIGKKATVKFFEYTTDGVPRFPKVICIRDYE